MKLNNKVVIGIIGGAGTGKTYIGNYIADNLEALFIEADAIGHKVIKQQAIIKKIADQFGQHIVVDYQVDRQLLGEIVFNNKDHLKALNGIMHIAMYQEIETIIKGSTSKYIVLEAAVMIEAGFDQLIDVMLCFEATESVRIERLVNKRNINKKRAIQILDSQQMNYKDYADHLIDTTLGLEAIESVINSILVKIRRI